jgi:hypothetical protein
MGDEFIGLGFEAGGQNGRGMMRIDRAGVDGIGRDGLRGGLDDGAEALGGHERFLDRIGGRGNFDGINGIYGIKAGEFLMGLI